MKYFANGDQGFCKICDKCLTKVPMSGPHKFEVIACKLELVA